jgi:hypothetical protein
VMVQMGKTVGWWLLLLVPLVSACMMPADLSGEKVAMLATCQSDSDCGAGLVCDRKVHVCVDDAQLSMAGWLRLLPPAQGMIAVEEQYPGMALTNQEDVTLTMHRPLRVLGRVLLEGSPHELQEAQIVAVADGTIPDLKIHQDAKATQAYRYDYENGETEKPGFELFVNQEKTYDVYVYLKETTGGQAFPPYHVRRSFSAGAEQGASHTVDWTIDVPKMASYRHIRGCLRLSGEATKPLVGARVVAFAAGNGNVSTAEISDVSGCFDLLVQPPEPLDEVLYEIHIRPSDENDLVPEQIVATASLSGRAAPEDAVPDSPEDVVDVGDLLVDGLHQLVTVRLELLALDETLTPEQLSHKNGEEEALALAQTRLDDLTTEMQGTVVGFSGIVGDGLLRVERSISDVVQTVDLEQGQVRVAAVVEVQLPPKSFVVNAVPTSQSRYGIQQFMVHLDPSLASQETITVTLTKKALTRVRVVDSEAQPVAGATFLAVLSNQGKYADVAPLPSRKYLAEETEEGLYELSLDQGVYTWVVDPPVEAGLPRLVVRDNSVQGASQQREVEIAPPAVVTGLVYGTLEPAANALEGDVVGLAADATEPGSDQAYQGPAPGVKVELYDEIEATSPADGLAPIPIAVAWSGENGRFVLIVPAR